ncbi:hypothetical protein [Nesterenkonia lutea]|uniref:AbiEi antitoxin C-terminal domain-containing protein n=1 Tax=Nesterenkonia lutea TaxID=272919 RepID=A0ABR9JD22_9MICC|nr:hypothetical protein [Nesterenkonia lutea]MBE1523837.1 hypothetical protein [Nesterenkonia lutea]
MGTSAGRTLPEGLYRPGPQFTAAELQVLVHEAVVRAVIGDVYACVNLPDSPGLRALGCRELLSEGLRAQAVLCGETAAWVHLGGSVRPGKITVITEDIFRRTTAAATSWQVHQVQLQPSEVIRFHEVPVTAELRTAADIFLGLGTAGSRRPLDLPPAPPEPGQPAPEHPGQSHCEPAFTDSAHRWELIRRLAAASPGAIEPEALRAQICSQLRSRSSMQARGTRIAALLQARVFGAEG